MRTFGRAEWLEAKQAWDDGEFGDEWTKIRELAAERGMIYPPKGSRWDDRDDPEPSPRAIVYRAMEDTPDTLRAAISSSRSWSDVIRKIILNMETRRDDADWSENRDAFRRETEPTPRQATAALGAIISRIADSTGAVLPSTERPDRSLTVDRSPEAQSTAAAPSGSLDIGDDPSLPATGEINAEAEPGEPGPGRKNP